MRAPGTRNPLARVGLDPRAWHRDLPRGPREAPVPEPQVDERAARIVRLWQCTLLQALDDAGSVRDHRQRERLQARLWLTRPSRERDFVLEAAGIDLAAFVERGLPWLRSRWATVDAEIERRAVAGWARASEAPAPRASAPGLARGRPDALQAA